MVLERGVGKYRGFALLAISMTGLTGSIGAIHANRLSTLLHTKLHPDSAASYRARNLHKNGLTPVQSMIALFILSFPVQGAFLAFVHLAGWSDVDLGWTGWVAYALTTVFSLLTAHFFTTFCWWQNLDPE
jgi:solute carrier family 41